MLEAVELRKRQVQESSARDAVTLQRLCEAAALAALEEIALNAQ